MSCRTRLVALAVKAAMGLPGKFWRSELSWRYSGRNSCPHSEMQWASSMAKNASGTRRSQAIVSGARQPLGREVEQAEGALRRGAHHSALLLGRLGAIEKAAGMPMSPSCATWSCMSAMSGEITTTVCPSASAGNW